MARGAKNKGGRGSRLQSDQKAGAVCRLCFLVKFDDEIGRACSDCHRKVCTRCGSFQTTDPSETGLKSKVSIKAFVSCASVCCAGTVWQL